MAAPRHPPVSAVALALLAWGVEVTFGWPAWLFRRVRHPVVWIGTLIAACDARCNDAAFTPAGRRTLGALCTGLVVGASVGVAALLSHALPDTPVGFALEALAASSLLASRSLHRHVRAVAAPLVAGDLDAARDSVSLIVGRDPASLDAAGVARAALESLAENASDGVVAPLCWCALFGLPGLAGYKAVNTLDSMIGHRTARHADFGRFAARLDDAANLVPARLCAVLFVLAGGLRATAAAVAREARRHRSPNAGWPESAAARSLGVRLSGPRGYGGTIAHEPWLNPGAPDPDGHDVLRGLALYRRALGLAAGALVLALAWTSGPVRVPPLSSGLSLPIPWFP